MRSPRMNHAEAATLSTNCGPISPKSGLRCQGLPKRVLCIGESIHLAPDFGEVGPQLVFALLFAVRYSFA